MQGASGRALDPPVSCISSGVTVLLPWHRVSRAVRDVRAAVRLSYGPPEQSLTPVLPAPASSSPHDVRPCWSQETAGEGQKRHIPARWRETRPQTHLLCLSSADASLLFSLSLCFSEASSCKVIPARPLSNWRSHTGLLGKKGEAMAPPAH